MEQISLRAFATLTCLDMLVYCETRREVKVVDDLGDEVVTDTMLLGMNWFGFIIHRHFPDEPYTVNEVIDLQGRDGYPRYIDDKLLKRPIDEFLPVVMPKYDSPEFYDLIRQYNFVHQNLLHNYLSIIGQKAVVSARALDVKNIYYHPKIQRIKKERREGKITTKEASIIFNRVMLDETDFDTSIFALLYRTKSLDVIQSYQLLIERGKVFDLNNTILPFNIDNSYAEGIKWHLADSIGESKGSGFALISNGAALQDSEWFHMKVHNLASVQRSVIYQYDCGSTRGPIVKVVSEAFRRNLQGKYYFKEDGSVKMITPQNWDEIKVGETIKLRSVAWCNHGSNGKPCSVCFGGMVSVIPYNPYTKRSAVPGMFFGSVFCSVTGQSILKSKHRIGSAAAVPFVVDKRDKKYITTDGDYIYFAEEFIDKEKRPFVILDRDVSADFADYIAMENVDDLDRNHLPTRETIHLRLRVPNPMFAGKFGVETPIVNTSIGSRKARMTKEFIRYLKDQRMEEEGRLYRISLENWDYKLPAYELPIVNEDLNAYRKSVEGYLRFTHLKGLIDEPVTEEMHGDQLLGFWKVVHPQNQASNIVVHDLLLHCCMAKDPKRLEYGLPSVDDERYFVSFHDAIMNRGQGTALMYGWQGKLLTGSPLNFLTPNRQGGVMESFLRPIAMF